MTYPREDALGTLVRRIRASGRPAAAAQDPTAEPAGWCLWVGDEVVARGQTRDQVAEAGEWWLEAAVRPNPIGEPASGGAGSGERSGVIAGSAGLNTCERD